MKLYYKYHFNNNFISNPKIFNDIFLFQLGEIVCESGAKINEHMQLDYFELTYVFSGSGKITSNNKSYNVTQHYIHISLPHEKHSIISDTIDPLRYGFCTFNCKKGTPLYNLIYLNYSLLSKTRIYCSKHYSVFFESLFSYINELNTNYDATLEFLIEYDLKLLITSIIHDINKGNGTQYNFPKANDTKMLCFGIVNYIDINLTEIRSISDIAQELQYNSSYLSRCFKKQMGITISTYISNKKLELSKELIEKNEQSITDISLSLGYSSLYVFSRAFHNKYGISPNEYKQQKLKTKKT